MTFSKSLSCLTSLCVATATLSTISIRATETNSDYQQRMFATPDDAIKALTEAIKNDDKSALYAIFGPEIKGVGTGDAVQDTNNFKELAAAFAEKCEPQPQGSNEIILNIGNDTWAYPIPLMKEGDQWYFDTAAGREEIINRHIGHDELNAIGVCQAFSAAQHKYYDLNPDGTGTKHYAQKFKSDSGQKNGLYWKSTGSEDVSPLNALVAEAHAEGYHRHNNTGAGPHPYHGYLFKILTKQGHAASGGKMSYLENGQLTKGAALVAYPDRWDQSGIMTFIVNQDGEVYQRNLGPKTEAIASDMTEYNPTSKWTKVQDQGINEDEQAAAAQK